MEERKRSGTKYGGKLNTRRGRRKKGLKVWRKKGRKKGSRTKFGGKESMTRGVKSKRR